MEDFEKKYKEALERAKVVNLGTTDYNIVTEIFPELRESEDEKIRKAILELVKQSSHILNPMNQKFMIDWLEKQCEVKSEIKYVYPKFRVGDVIEPAKPNGHYVPVRIKYIGEGNYYCESDDRKSFLSFPICDENEYVLTESKPAWSEEDEMMWCGIIETEQYMLDVVNGVKIFDVGNITIKESCSKELNWLKSLKERMKGE